ncbi:RNA-binding protein 1-like isoform X2 [Miscanthus floridulus]|uniref:RNA-binding protein 1-like isoform X2 n=1 Tax=Miscanthus floridulus TaxID=154761 RepID=UPI003459F57A
MDGRPPPPYHARSSALPEAYGRPFAGEEHPSDSRVGYPSYLAPEGSVASYYTSRPSVLPGGPDVLRNDVMLQPRAYGFDGPAGVMNPALAGLTGLPVGAMARGSSALEDPSLAVLSGRAPARALGPSPLKEEPDVVGRSSSLGTGASIPDVERHSSLPNFDGPSEDESNILFVDCLPTDCTRREVAHLFRVFPGFKDIRVVHKEPRRDTALMTGSLTALVLRSNSQGSLSLCLPPRIIGSGSSVACAVGTVDGV